MPHIRPPHEIVAEEIRAELARKQIPQARLALLLNLSEVSVSRRLRGETPLDVNELLAIADYLDIPVARLLPHQVAS